jgi:hypothetical protein
MMKKFAVAAVAAAGIALGVGACAPPSAPTTPPPSHSVTYEIESAGGLNGGTPSVDLTYQTPTGVGQVNGASTGWTVNYTMPDGGFMYVSGQNATEYGTVTCRIKVDGNVVSQNTSSGAYSIATCSGSA